MGLWGLHNPVAGVPLSNYQITMVHGPNGYRCGCHWVCGYGQWGCITQFFMGVSAHMEWSVGPNGYRVVPNWGAAMVVWGCTMQSLVYHCKVGMVNGGHGV